MKNTSERVTSREDINAVQTFFERNQCVFQEVAQQNDFGKDGYPVGFERLCAFFSEAGVEYVEKLATRPSRFGGTMYSVFAERSKA